MSFTFDYKGNKGFRLLNMYERLNKGEIIFKGELATSFGVTPKTIQRDIEDLRTYLTENHSSVAEIAIKYNKSKKGYYLVRNEKEWLTNEEVLALCKILLESRAFCKEELNGLINKLLTQVSPSDRKKVESVIRNEQHYYVPLRHEKQLFKIIWDLSQYITTNEIVKFIYTRQDGRVKERKVKPLSIMFSEYYFYLIGYLVKTEKDFPIVFRIDRIQELSGTKEKFRIPYKDQFNEGEFRKRVQFMYSGDLKKVKFEFLGTSIEAVLDRLPTAKVISKENNVYTIEAESYGKGIDMWLASQGEAVKVLEEG